MTSQELHRVWAQMSPRLGQVLAHRLLDDLSREQCSSLYGLTLGQWDALFLRAARDFEQCLGRPSLPGDDGAATALLNDSLTLELRELQGSRAEVKAHIASAIRAHEASPQYVRETWLRRLAIAAIIGLSLWFYWQQKSQAPRFEPRTPPPASPP